MAKCVMDIVNRINESFVTLGKMDIKISRKIQESFIISKEASEKDDLNSDESQYSKKSTERNQYDR